MSYGLTSNCGFRKAWHDAKAAAGDQLLQLTQRELMDFVTRELDENPLLRLPRTSRAPALPGEEAGEQDWLGQLAGPAPALRDHLLQQLGQSNFSASERRLALHLIDALDDHGYLRLDLREMAEEPGCEEAVLEALPLRLQHLNRRAFLPEI